MSCESQRPDASIAALLLVAAITCAQSIGAQPVAVTPTTITFAIEDTVGSFSTDEENL